MGYFRCVKSPNELKEELLKIKQSSSFKSLGFVPTMGALHQGHQSLIRRAREDNSHVVVSVFVNPKQFGPNEDYNQYPRTLENDCRLIESTGAQVVFAPGVETIYPPGFQSVVRVLGLADFMCGLSRPGHFDGVCTIVSLLFNLIQPNKAYFGLKDYQQVAIIKKMVGDLSFPVEIVGCPIHRDADGLASSSRNVYLDAAARKHALAIPQSLFEGASLFFDKKIRSAPEVLAHVENCLKDSLCGIEWSKDYVGVYHPETLIPIANDFDSAILALALRVPGSGGKHWVRLIDNVALTPEGLGDFNTLRAYFS